MFWDEAIAIYSEKALWGCYKGNYPCDNADLTCNRLLLSLQCKLTVLSLGVDSHESSLPLA